MITMLFIFNAMVAVALVILILLQRADTGAGGAFGGGSGGAQPVIRNPLAKPTAILAGLFLVNSLLIAYVQKGGDHGSVVDKYAPSTQAAPAPTEGAPANMMDATDLLVQPEPATPAMPAPEIPAAQ